MNVPLIKVLKAGLQTTVQDLGRKGYQRFGISPSGAMDAYALQMANILVGNPLGESGLEVTIIGPRLEAMADVSIAICGGDLKPMVNNEEVPMWRCFVFKKGDVLSFGKGGNGARAYICFAGGIDVPLVLGSKSTFINGGMGGLDGRQLEQGDSLHGNPFVRRNRFLHKDFIPEYKTRLEIRVILGPHLEKFTSNAIEQFLSGDYMVSPQSNRMGYRLEGPELSHIGGADIISDAIPAGGIQVPSNGQPIILMAERQTTGGYARIATVISVDLPILAQAMPGTEVRFVKITVKEAQKLYLKRKKLLQALAVIAH